MKEIDIEQLINMNYRVLTLLGMATSIIMDYKNLSAYHDNSAKCNWFMDAITNVVYLNKPIPPMPEDVMK
jgi:hypothetical protein